jgi:hypothetical protein
MAQKSYKMHYSRNEKFETNPETFLLNRVPKAKGNGGGDDKGLLSLCSLALSLPKPFSLRSLLLLPECSGSRQRTHLLILSSTKIKKPYFSGII